jgi:hypothetical protein
MESFVYRRKSLDFAGLRRCSCLAVIEHSLWNRSPGSGQFQRGPGDFRNWVHRTSRITLLFPLARPGSVFGQGQSCQKRATFLPDLGLGSIIRLGLRPIPALEEKHV